MTTEQQHGGETSQERQTSTQGESDGSRSGEQSRASGEGAGSALSSQSEQRPSRTGSVGARGSTALGRPPYTQGQGPLSLMRRFSEDMDRLFEGFFGPGLLGRDMFGSLGPATRWPELEVHQEGNRWVVQADLPGLRREDVNVEVREDQLVISGERVQKNESNEGGYYRTERSYGSFTRAIPLPEGANLESASAKFEHGVLRIELEVPEQQQRSRRIEVREGSPQ
jgi:HSP20 family protein